MWASPWGPQTERREGAKGGRRARRARACLPNLVSETTRAATSYPGPVATLQREVPLQTEGVCLSTHPLTVPDDGGLARVSLGYPHGVGGPSGDPVGVWRLPASLGHAPATVTASSARPGLLNAAAAPPF